MKRILTVFLTLLLVFMNTSFVYSLEEVKIVDENYDEAKLKLETKDKDGYYISGIKLSIYKVADVHNSNNNLTFLRNGEYINFFGEVSDMDFDEYLLTLNPSYTEGFSTLLDEYVKNESLVPIQSKTSDENGYIEFDHLTLGVYLVVDENTNSKYYPISSFLVSVPSKNEITGLYSYEVNGTPKIEKLRPIPNTPPEEPPVPEEPSTYIPNTSLPWLDATICAISGLAFVLVGTYMIKRGRNA